MKKLERYIVRYEYQRGDWHLWRYVDVEAESEQEAKEKALPFARKKNESIQAEDLVICRNGLFE
jgi:hypothetical protein